MPVEYRVTPEAIELRCPKCKVFVGHARVPMEAPLCTDCVRLEKAIEPLQRGIDRILRGLFG